MTLAGEVSAALREAGVATAGAPQIAQLVVSTDGRQTPWDTGAFAQETLTPLAIVTDTYSQGVVDGTLIRADDLRVMADAGPVAPSTAHKLRIGGVDHAIVAARPLAPGGVALMWELQCRR